MGRMRHKPSEKYSDIDLLEAADDIQITNSNSYMGDLCLDAEQVAVLQGMLRQGAEAIKVAARLEGYEDENRC